MNGILLPVPILLNENIDLLAEKMKLEHEVAENLALYHIFICPDDIQKTGIIACKNAVEWKEDGYTIEDLHTGDFAIHFLNEALHLELPVIPAVVLPKELPLVVSKKRMNDIAFLHKRIALQRARFDKLKALEGGCPQIVLDNEMRMIHEMVETLNRNGYNGKQRLNAPDGTKMRSLYDYGYSLRDGWSDTMKEIIANIVENSKNSSENCDGRER